MHPQYKINTVQQPYPMKKLAYLLFATAFLFTGKANAQVASLASNSADAKLIIPISIVASASKTLNFGTLLLVSTTSETKITLAAATGNVTSADDLRVKPVGSTNSRAEFTVTGEVDVLFDITIVAGSVLTDALGAGADMSLEGYNFSAVTTLDVGSTGNAFSINTGTTGVFAVGADLIVGSGQAAAIYSGTYSVAVAYQ